MLPFSGSIWEVCNQSEKNDSCSGFFSDAKFGAAVFQPMYIFDTRGEVTSNLWNKIRKRSVLDPWRTSTPDRMHHAPPGPGICSSVHRHLLHQDRITHRSLPGHQVGLPGTYLDWSITRLIGRYAPHIQYGPKTSPRQSSIGKWFVKKLWHVIHEYIRKQQYWYY